MYITRGSYLATICAYKEDFVEFGNNYIKSNEIRKSHETLFLKHVFD